MAFGNFGFPQVVRDLGLTMVSADLTGAASVLSVNDEFQSRLQFGAEIALAINTEKARSEFIIAPILLELRRLAGPQLNLFSGVELHADDERGLSGVCDFLLTVSGVPFVVTAPFVSVVEAKNDNLANGMGQCIASLVAAQIINEREGHPGRNLCGVVTTGTTWRFLRLRGNELAIDPRECLYSESGKILGILLDVVQRG